NAALSGTRLYERGPFLEELGRGRLRLVYGRIIGHGALAFGLPEGAVLSSPHFGIVERRKGDEGRAAHASGDDDKPDLADDVVEVERREAASLAREHFAARKLHELLKRGRARRAAAHGRKARSRRADLAVIDIDIKAVRPHFAGFRVRFAPSHLRVLDNDGRRLLSGLLLDLRELFHVLRLDRESAARAAHRYVHYFGEIAPVRRCDVCAVICGNIRRAARLAGRPEKAHRRAHFTLQNRFAHFRVFFFGELRSHPLFHESHEAIDRFDPRLATAEL